VSFVKLDTGILNSTLWDERGQRDVFLTALLMAEPREFTEPVQQLAVGEIMETGFAAPPGWYGFVRSSGPGIVRMALVGHDEGMEALRRLGEPDPESRSSAFEGRRLVRVDGGYVVLNYMRYRDRDTSAAERMRKLRERRKVTVNGDAVTPNAGEHSAQSTPVPPNVTQTEAEADTETEKSVSKSAAPAAAAGEDFKAGLFRRWKALPNSGGGAFLNKLFRDYKPEQRVVEAVERTLDDTRADPKAFVIGVLNSIQSDDDVPDWMLPPKGEA
jgi:hypothetical protein